MTKTKIERILIVIGVLIIPLLYSALYLGAFWDPYHKLADVPVGIVNLDKCITKDNQKMCLGNELVDKLLSKKQLAFKEISRDKAYDELLDENYYAVITIPEDFSSNVINIDNQDSKQTKIVYSSNEKRNYLASQILNQAITKIEKEVQKEVTFSVVSELTDNLQEVPGSLKQVNSSVAMVNSSVSTLYDGSNTVTGGLNELSGKYQTFNDYLNELSNSGLLLSDNTKKLSDNVNLLAGKTTELSTGFDALAKQENVFNTTITSYTTSTQEVINNYNKLLTIVSDLDIYDGLDNQTKAYIDVLNSPATVTNINTLYNASDIINSSSSTLNTTIASIDGKIKVLNGSVSQLNDKTLELSGYMNKLASGTSELGNNSLSVVAGINKLSNGSSQISDGLYKLNDGTNLLNSKLNSSVSNTEAKTSNLFSLAKKTASAIEIDEEPIEMVPNYGTAFAPYFMSLSLWVGCLMIFVGIYMDTDDRFKILSRNSTHPIIRTFSYLVLALSQGLILGFILRYVLNLEIINPFMYYVSILFVSTVFMSIIQLLMIGFKDIGKFLIILLLILQLTSCGGTFPMETLPKLFNLLYSFMPMTYSVGLFKEAISGSAGSIAFNDVAVLMGILIVFTVGMVLLGINKLKKKEVN